MAFADFLHLSFFDIEQCVSAIFLQLILPPFSPVVILPFPNVYLSITPLLPLSIPSLLFVYLIWPVLPSWNISLCLQWVNTFSLPIPIEVSPVTAISWSSILHLSQWVFQSLSIDTSKRCIVKLSIIEHTHSLPWMTLLFRMCVLNDSESMWESVEQCADLQGYFHLIHLLNRSILIIIFIGMNDSVFVVFFKLIIALLQIIEVVEEGVHGS